MRKQLLWICGGGHLGELSLKALARNPRWQITSVWTDRRSHGIIQWAKGSRIPLHIGKPKKILSKGQTLKADVLLSLNYLFLLPQSVLASVPIAINIHGALLPKYRGRTPNTWAIINDEVETGITVHEMTKEVDAGDILYQEKIPISNTDTGWSLIERLSRRYPIILNKVLMDIAKGKVVRQPQNGQKQSYCGKREPSDGLVDWRWSARKVYNWVRAQTKPYPGAFFFHQRKKYMLWRVEECYDPKFFLKKKAGSPFFIGKDMFIRCGRGAVKIIDFEIIEGRHVDTKA